MDTQNFSPIQKSIVEKLQNIYDPEIPVNVWDMGLIYDISVDEDKNVVILMTLTAPNCPVAESLPIDVQKQIETIPEIKSVNVKITFEPIWNMDMMSESAKLTLGFL